MKKLLQLTTAIMVLSSPAAYAQTGYAELTPEHFAKLDGDKNGRISLAEYEKFMRESFATLDANGDKVLSPVEAEKVFTPQQFATVDKNNDGKISLDEFLDQVIADFHRQDLNKDGEIQP